MAIAPTSNSKVTQFLTEEPGLSVFGLLWKHKFKVLTTVTGVMLLAIVFLIISDRTYRSEAKLYVRAGGRGVTIQNVSTTENLPIADSQQREVYAVSELLQSRLMSEMVVDQFGTDVLLNENKEKKDPFKLAAVKTTIKGLLSNLNDFNLNPLQKFDDRDEAIEEFEKNSKVLPTKTSSVISISFDFTDPQTAHDILEFMVQAAMDEHFRVHRTPGSQPFFTEQTDLIRSHVAELEKQLRDWKNKNGLASLELQRASAIELIGDLEKDFILSSTRLASLEAEASNRRDQMENMDAEVVLERATDQPNSIGQTLRSKIYDLESLELDLASRFTENHPTLVSTRERLSEARKMLGKEKEAVGVTTGINPNFQAAELALRSGDAAIDGQRELVASLQRKLASARAELERLNAAEAELSEMERELTLARTNYKVYAENLEQARINEELERAKIFGLTLMQPPTISQTPIWPLPILILPLGMVFGCCAGVGVAILAENRRRLVPIMSIRPDHQSSLPVPTEVEIEEISQKRPQVVPQQRVTVPR